MVTGEVSRILLIWSHSDKYVARVCLILTNMLTSILLICLICLIHYILSYPFLTQFGVVMRVIRQGGAPFGDVLPPGSTHERGACGGRRRRGGVSIHRRPEFDWSLMDCLHHVILFLKTCNASLFFVVDLGWFGQA